MPGGKVGAWIILIACIVLLVAGVYILLAPTGDAGTGVPDQWNVPLDILVRV